MRETTSAYMCSFVDVNSHWWHLFLVLFIFKLLLFDKPRPIGLKDIVSAASEDFLSLLSSPEKATSPLRAAISPRHVVVATIGTQKHHV
jgi:hypothetical protein